MSSTSSSSRCLRVAVPAVALLAAAASSALAVDAYTIGTIYDDAGQAIGSSLLRYSTSSPGSVTEIPLSGGSAAVGPFLDSIDSRPANGQLYGYLSAANEYYTINTTTGALTTVSAASVGPGANSLSNGIDWNPTIDRLRLVSDAGDNIVFNPTPGTTTAAANLFYVAGDPGFGTNPAIIDNAYTNSYAGATTTTQYALDYTRNALVRLNNNTGELTTVAAVTLNGQALDFDNFTGFDIYTDGSGNNIAYAQFFDGASDGLYTINLASGAATFLGTVNDAAYGFGYSLAVVPEPTTLAGLTSLALIARRRR